MNKISVIGIGNPLRCDDGIGIYLINKLKNNNNNNDFKNKIKFIDGGTGGFNLIHLLSNFDIVILIDAIDFDGKPGETILIKYKKNQDYIVDTKIATHEWDIFKIIELSKKLNQLPEIFIFGIQPEDISFRTTFSNSIDNKIDNIFEQLKKEIQEILKLN